MKKRLLIGVIVTECHIDFQEEILGGIISQAFRSKCDIAIIAPLYNFFSDSVHRSADKKIFDLILSEKFDGFLYDRNSFFGDGIRKYIDDQLKRSGKPVMLLDFEEHRSFETTSIDDSEAFEAITDHLIEEHSLRKIYCLTGPRNLFVSEERLKGYKNSMKKHGIEVAREWCRYGDFWTACAQSLAESIASGELEMPQAVVCGNDASAIQLIKSLAINGIRVPEDVAVTGYDASLESYTNHPSVTTYRHPNYQLGAESFRRLYRIITGRICNKIPNEKGMLRLGESCGCGNHTGLKSSVRRRLKIGERFERTMLYSDMLFDISRVSTPEEFADRLDNYTYFIYRMSHFDLYLTRKYIESASGDINEKLTFTTGDEVRPILSKSLVLRRYFPDEYISSNDILHIYGEDRKYPVAYYITPLHYNDNFFGYAAVSFGKDPIAYAPLYMQWINYVSIALEQVRIRAVMNRTISDVNHDMLYDSVTGTLNRRGIERTLEERLGQGIHSAEAECIRINLTGIGKMYYQSGEKKCDQLLKNFTAAVENCVKNGEIYGIWSNNTIGIVSFTAGRSESLYRSLCTYIKESEYDEKRNCSVDFTLGSCTMSLRRSYDLSDSMYKAAVNRLYTYNISDNTGNPQFEKLCRLRNELRSAPEKQWKISDIADELFLSKSYLQKIYKTYFGKSIIKEMIQFRIDRAKELLLNTDMTVTEIARECGYSSYNYFARQFKTIEGISPSDYRSTAVPEKQRQNGGS